MWEQLTASFDNLKKKVNTAITPTPAPSAYSNAAYINGGSKRSGSKRKRSKKVRFSKKHKIYTYKRK